MANYGNIFPTKFLNPESNLLVLIYWFLFLLLLLALVIPELFIHQTFIVCLVCVRRHHSRFWGYPEQNKTSCFYGAYNLLVQTDKKQSKLYSILEDFQCYGKMNKSGKEN